ncbi:MAG: hypothetical protein U0802_23505 [Candidatus Binatia bacterium]
MTLAFQDWDFRVLCPLLPGGRALFGDVARYATMGDRRIAAVAASDDAVSFDVIGMPGTVAEIHGCAPQASHSGCVASAHGERALARGAAAGTSGGDVFWHDSSGRWVVRAAIDVGGRVRVTLRW